MVPLAAPAAAAVPVNEVGGAVDGVNDPGGIVCENTGGAGGDRLLTDEAADTPTPPKQAQNETSVR